MKKKQDNDKKITIIFISLIIIIFIIILIIIKSSNKNNFKIEVVNNCNISFHEYLKLDDSTIYLNCLKDIKIKENGEYITVKEYLKANDVDKLLNELDLEKTLKDGGTKIYSNKDIKVIKCNTSSGNKDIYIGSSTMNQVDVFENKGCGKNFFNDKEFKRIYKIESIEEGNEENNYVIVFADELGNKVTSTRLDKTVVEKLKVNKEYIITFNNKYGELIKDEMATIFEKCAILKIEEVK